MEDLFEMIKEREARKARAELKVMFKEFVSTYTAIVGSVIIHNNVGVGHIANRLHRVQTTAIATLNELKEAITPDDYIELGEFAREFIQDACKELTEMMRNKNNPEYVKKMVLKSLLAELGGEDDED